MRAASMTALVLAALLHAFVPSAHAGDSGGQLEPVDPAIRAKERAALIAFYEALGGLDWIQRDFWSSDKPVGEWQGVKTDADGRVVLLKIYDNNLQGELSPAVCDLDRLHVASLVQQDLGTFT